MLLGHLVQTLSRFILSNIQNLQFSNSTRDKVASLQYSTEQPYWNFWKKQFWEFEWLGSLMNHKYIRQWRKSIFLLKMLFLRKILSSYCRLMYATCRYFTHPSCSAEWWWIEIRAICYFNHSGFLSYSVSCFRNNFSIGYVHTCLVVFLKRPE